MSPDVFFCDASEIAAMAFHWDESHVTQEGIKKKQEKMCQKKGNKEELKLGITLINSRQTFVVIRLAPMAFPPSFISFLGIFFTYSTLMTLLLERKNCVFLAEILHRWQMVT